MNEKVLVENIVFLEGEDYTQMCLDIDKDYTVEGCIAAWMTNNQIIEYLFQWYFPGEHSIDKYNAEYINTGFLGYKRIIDDNTFLYSHNTRMGYAGLSRIVGYENG
jgi:hypothetical protein